MDTTTGLVVGSLLALIAFMGRHYFLRVERHLGLNHQLRNWINELHLRLARVERHLFGKEGVTQLSKSPKDESKDEKEE